MDLVLVFLAGIAVGLVTGVVLGAARAFRLVAARRAVAGASAGLGRLGLGTLPTRSAADILAGRIRLVLGGTGYELPVLPRRASREWLAALDGRFAHLARELDQAADDAPRILGLLAGQSGVLLEMLRSYDTSGILPAAEYLDDYASDSEILVAMVEVWRAANPLAATLAEAAEETSTTSSERPNTPLTPTVGDLETSTG